MFQSAAKRLRALLLFADDILGDPPDVGEALHPHRHELRWERKRRAGSVPPPPAHCLSPIRPGRRVGGRDQAIR